MKKQFTILMTSILLIGCSTGILDSKTEKNVTQRLQERTWLPEYKTSEMTENEKQAMDFLYAWMSVADVADFSSDLFYQNVKSSLAIREEMNWNVPDDLFLHFVLPVRVNNENLDYSRIAFSEEIKDRVKGLSMEDAILEVNHWCHEKVVYMGSDSRTISPSAIVTTTYGRCGEESTFCVAALRSVGIPARQIYTPRWAHTDDNHAWVEAWANGKWYYIGACEPEVKLNHGWFDSPAHRGLLMSTKVFGYYEGKEEVISRSDNYTEINVTENYTPVKTHYSVVKDENSNIVSGADVLYCIYNYAELYPAVKRVSDDNGICSMTSGYGDMVVWASKDGKYGFSKINPNIEDTVTVILNKTENDIYGIDMDIVPPVEKNVPYDVTPEQAKLNKERMAEEDKIRNSYIATFMTEEAAKEFATKQSLNSEKVWYFIKNARGNWKTIISFLEGAKNKERAMLLLENISIKDLKDTPRDVLNDHLLNSNSNYESSDMYAQYVLSPRIDDELITDFRFEFQKIHNGSIEKINELISQIQLCGDLNPANLRMTPKGVVKIMIGDKESIERAGIALFRSAGIPSRREPISEKPQYFDGTDWVYISYPQLDEVSEKVEGTGKLIINFNGKKRTKKPNYYSHYTISRISDCQPRLIEIEHSAEITTSDDGYINVFGKEISMPIGTYELVSGTRLADGSVLSHIEFFKIEAEKTTALELNLREKEDLLQVIGNMDPECIYTPEGSNNPSSILNTTGRGFFTLALMDAKKEPSMHMMRALESLNDQFDKWGRKIVLIFQDKNDLELFNKQDFSGLKTNLVCYGYDSEGKITAMMQEMVKADVTHLPVLIVADTFGRVVYTSVGYNTSTSEQLQQVIKQLMKISTK